jgi:hypothetical protein
MTFGQANRAFRSNSIIRSPPLEQIDDGGNVELALRCPDIGEVGDPFSVGSRYFKGTVTHVCGGGLACELTRSLPLDPVTAVSNIARAKQHFAVAGGRIQLRLKIGQADLAAMAGVARENVSRTMSEWRKRDIVTRSSNYYCINDPKALAQDMEVDSSCS